jgi:hypothetical protein
MAIRDADESIESNHRRKGELPARIMQDGARILNHRGSRIQNKNERASLCDYTQRFVGGVQDKSLRHDRSDQARGSRRCAYLAVIGAAFAVFNGL